MAASGLPSWGRRRKRRFDQRRTCHGERRSFVAGLTFWRGRWWTWSHASPSRTMKPGRVQAPGAAQQFFELGVTRVGDVVDFALWLWCFNQVAMMTKHRWCWFLLPSVMVCERFVGYFLRHQLEDGLGNFGIGGVENREHGSPYWGWILAPEPLAMPVARTVCLSPTLRFCARRLWARCVCGRDGVCRFVPEGRLYFGQRGVDFVCGQRFGESQFVGEVAAPGSVCAADLLEVAAGTHCQSIDSVCAPVIPALALPIVLVH